MYLSMESEYCFPLTALAPLLALVTLETLVTRPFQEN